MLKVKMTFFSSLDQFQKTKSFSTARNHLETTLTNFGPFFKIEMMLKLKSFPNPEEHSGWANIFVIGNGEPKFSVKGARYPSMFLRATKHFHFSTFTNAYHSVDTLHNLQESNTYHIIIEQKLIDCKWTFRIFVDSIMIDSTENTEPMVLDEAKLYLSAPWNPTANAEITHLKIEY